MNTITLTVTAKMTDEQLANWAQDNDVTDVPADLATYIEHNLLRPSNAAECYMTDIAVATAGVPAGREDVRS